MKISVRKLFLPALIAVGMLVSCEKEDTSVKIYDLQLVDVDYVLVPKGSSATLKWKVIPIHTTDKSITWKNSNEEVVRLNDGVVEGLKEGTVIITAIANSDISKKIEWRIRVLPKAIEQIILDVASSVTLEKGQELKVNAQILPADAPQEIEWKSSDKGIVSINNEGVLKAIQPGEAIISVGSASDYSKSNSFKVIVKGLEEKLLDKSKFVALPNSSQFQFSAFGTSNVSILWDGISNLLGAKDIFYITNKSEPYIGLDLGISTKLTSMRYWGRTDNYFVLRHAKTLKIYGTNNETTAKNPDSPDSDWILLTETPFESTRPSDGLDKPIQNDADWTYALAGERFVFNSSIPKVRYVRVKCTKTWGNLEGFWATELAFWGE